MTRVAGLTSNLEAVILVARLLSFGILLGLSYLALLALSPWTGVQGAQAPTPGLFGQVERAGSRKAVPVTRGQELGLRFRPDDNASPYAQPGFAPTDPGRPGSDALQSQFRPIPKRRKPTYEELQSEMAPAPQPGVGPIMPYPLGAPPLPGYGPYPPPL